jgi:hypothetical protein
MKSDLVDRPKTKSRDESRPQDKQKSSTRSNKSLGKETHNNSTSKGIALEGEQVDPKLHGKRKTYSDQKPSSKRRSFKDNLAILLQIVGEDSHILDCMVSPQVDPRDNGLKKHIDQQPMTKKAQSSIALLESEDLDENRIGMQRLVLASKPVPTTPGDELVARALVYGGTNEESREERLRGIFLVTFLCTLDDEDDDDGEDDDGEDGPRGKSWDALHTGALRVVVNALEQIISTDTDNTTASIIDFTDSFWKQVVSTLIHNVELCHNSEDVTIYSLKCLRLLHTLEPIVVKPLLQHTLMPYLLYLQDYGRREKFPMVECEASRLIKRAEIMTTRYSTRYITI